MNQSVVKFIGGVSILGSLTIGNSFGISLERIEKMSERISAKLSLDEGQKLKYAELVQLIKEETEKMNSLKYGVHFKKKNKLTTESILQQMDSIHGQRKEALNRILPELISFRETLSPKQQEKFNRVFRRYMKKVAKRWS